MKKLFTLDIQKVYLAVKQCAALLIFICICGCSSPVSLGHYSIEFFAHAATDSPLVNVSAGIEEFTSVKALERNEILIRSTHENQVLFSSDSFWWALPREMIDETFHSYLRSRNVFVHTLRYPALQKIAYVVQGRIHRFEVRIVENDWKVLTAMEICLVEADTQEILWKSGIVKDTTPCNSNMADAAAAMEKNLVKVYTSLIDKLSGFLKQNR